jgi:hypothetical protein
LPKQLENQTQEQIEERRLRVQVVEPSCEVMTEDLRVEVLIEDTQRIICKTNSKPAGYELTREKSDHGRGEEYGSTFETERVTFVH